MITISSTTITPLDKIQTKKGQQVDIATNEEEELRLDNPLLTTQQLNEYPEDKLTEAMHKEMESMRSFDVYIELLESDVTPEQLSKVIQSRWVLRWKADEIRLISRLTQALHYPSR